MGHFGMLMVLAFGKASAILHIYIKADPSPMLYPMNLLSLALRCLAIAEERNLGQSRTEALLLS